MSEPAFTETTERLYERLPSYLRTYDIAEDWPLKTWLSGAGDQESLVDTLVDRFTYVSPGDGPGHRTSDLVDPQTADAAWLPWLAQLAGVTVDPTDTVQQRRESIRTALSGIKAGTTAAMTEVARKALTGSKSVFIYPHSTTNGVGTGGPWDLLVLTVDSETVSSPTDAIVTAGAKPAGIRLHHATFGASWDTIEAQRPTWDDWETDTWQRVEETGL